VEHVEIVVPTGSDAAWALDRSVLWNAAEAAENRKDAREIEVALPHEMTDAQRLGCLWGTFSPSRCQIRSTRLSLIIEPARRSSAATLR
jgi:hypothetical protein